jgi:hypothetical protein
VKAYRKYTLRMMLAMFAYTIILFPSVAITRNLPEVSWLRYPISVLPVIPVVVGAAVYLNFLRNIDELQRRIQLDGIAFGFAATAIISITLGFLENAGVPRIGMIWVFPMLCAFWGLGIFLANRRYRE